MMTFVFGVERAFATLDGGYLVTHNGLRKNLFLPCMDFTCGTEGTFLSGNVFTGKEP